jgi:hypothetical protein
LPDNLAIYELHKDEMKTGDLLEWSSPTIIGWGIRFVTGEMVNHSSLLIRLREYEGLDRRRFTTEAVRHGTVLTRMRTKLEHHKGECYWYALKDEWNPKRQVIGEKALQYIGIPYDFGSIFKQLVARVGVDFRSLFCSEYCWLCYGMEGEAPYPGEITKKLDIFKPPVRLL